MYNYEKYLITIVLFILLSVQKTFSVQLTLYSILIRKILKRNMEIPLGNSWGSLERKPIGCVCMEKLSFKELTYPIIRAGISKPAVWLHRL